MTNGDHKGNRDDPSRDLSNDSSFGTSTLNNRRGSNKLRKPALRTVVSDKEGVELARKYGRRPENLGTIEEHFPIFYGIMTRSGPVRWPSPDEADATRRFLRVIELWEQNDESGADNYFFWHINLDLKAQGRPSWSQKAFSDLYNRALMKAEQKELDELKSRAGRKPTELTRRIQTICETLDCSKPRAYMINADGTGGLQDRKKLAVAFSHDPVRNYPAAWELKFGGKRGRPSGRPTLCDYILSGDDDFEEFGAALARLKTACRRGDLPTYFADLETFITAVEPFAVDAATALVLWRRSKAWCEGR